jgi:hypothetical protein
MYPTKNAQDTTTCPRGLSHSKSVFVHRIAYAPAPTLKTFRTKNEPTSSQFDEFSTVIGVEKKPICDLVLQLLLGTKINMFLFSRK